MLIAAMLFALVVFYCVMSRFYSDAEVLMILLLLVGVIGGWIQL